MSVDVIDGLGPLRAERDGSGLIDDPDGVDPEGSIATAVTHRNARMNTYVYVIHEASTMWAG